MKATIAGCPDTIAAKVRQLSEMGINHLHLRFLGEIDGETSHICKDLGRVVRQGGDAALRASAALVAAGVVGGAFRRVGG